MQGLTSAARAEELIIDPIAPPTGAPADRTYGRAPAALPLPGGLGSNAAVRATIAAMIGIVQAADQIDRATFPRAKKPTPPLTFARNVYMACTSRWFTFAEDPAGEERLRDPLALAAQIGQGHTVDGDCDDRAMTLALMLRMFDIPAAFIVIGREENGPYEHVYTAADGRAEGVRWPLELTDSAPITPIGADAALLSRLIPMDPQEGTPFGEWTQPMRRLAVFPIP